jgi:enterochelin esterase-like enzyme
MKLLSFLLIAAGSLAQETQTPPNWLDPNRSEPAGTHYRTFHSRLAGSDVSYLIYLPPDYDSNTARRYPVVYWLHGYGGNQRAGAVFVTPLDAAIRAGKAPPMIAVLVNGLAASFYCDSQNGKLPVDSVITQDLIPHIDQTYRTIARRQDRAVEGFSMGGYGAAHLGFKHPDLFGMVSIFSGALTDSVEWGELHPPQGGRRKQMLAAPKAYFEANDLATVIRRNADTIRGRTRVRMAVGAEDSLLPNNRALHEFLTQLKIAHEFEILPGVGHNSAQAYKAMGERAFAWYGNAAPAAACQGVAIHPGVDVQSAIASHPAGSTYCFAPGLYRLAQSIVPKEGNRLIGAPGAVLNGSKLVTNWTRQGNLWIATGQTQHSEGLWKSTWPQLANPAAQFNEDLFFDGRQFEPVLNAAEVAPGKFYFDYAAGKIYLADDPIGHEVESSVVAVAIRANAPRVTVRGFTIGKFIDAGISAGQNSLVEENEVRYVHGTGIRFGSGARILHNRTHHNGMYGMSGAGESPVVEGNEIAFNDTAGYYTIHGGCWAAGGAKFVRSNHMVVRGNHVHDNYCTGLWSDIDNIHTTYEDNRIENNHANGLFIEISYEGVIRNNVITGNMAAGLLFNSSSDQDVYGNRLEGNGVSPPGNVVGGPVDNRGDIVIIQQKRGSGEYGERLSKNIFVHDNIVAIAAPVTGATRKQGSPTVFEQNNRFQNNHYTVPDLAGKWWVWKDGPSTWKEWQAAGQDTTADVKLAARAGRE